MLCQGLCETNLDIFKTKIVLLDCLQVTYVSIKVYILPSQNNLLPFRRDVICGRPFSFRYKNFDTKSFPFLFIDFFQFFTAIPINYDAFVNDYLQQTQIQKGPYYVEKYFAEHRIHRLKKKVSPGHISALKSIFLPKKYLFISWVIIISIFGEQRRLNEQKVRATCGPQAGCLRPLIYEKLLFIWSKIYIRSINDYSSTRGCLMYHLGRDVLLAFVFFQSMSVAFVWTTFKCFIRFTELCICLPHYFSFN